MKSATRWHPATNYGTRGNRLSHLCLPPALVTSGWLWCFMTSRDIGVLKFELFKVFYLGFPLVFVPYLVLVKSHLPVRSRLSYNRFQPNKEQCLNPNFFQTAAHAAPWDSVTPSSLFSTSREQVLDPVSFWIL